MSDSEFVHQMESSLSLLGARQDAWFLQELGMVLQGLAHPFVLLLLR